jgi:hypothetical protein
LALEDEAGSVAVDLTGAKAAAGLVTGEHAVQCPRSGCFATAVPHKARVKQPGP